MRVVALAVVALLLVPGCGFFDGLRFGVEQGSGSIDSTTRPGGFDSEELRFTISAEKDIGGRLASRKATGRHQARVESLLAPEPSPPELTADQEEIISLGLRIDTQRGLIWALETERDELREAVKAHHDEPPVTVTEGSIYTALMLAIGVLGKLLSNAKKDS